MRDKCNICYHVIVIYLFGIYVRCRLSGVELTIGLYVKRNAFKYKYMGSDKFHTGLMNIRVYFIECKIQ